MLFHHRILGGMTGASVLLTMVVAGCSGLDSPTEAETMGTSEQAIIAGVDAKSASLNAVGSLVEIYRYTTCAYPCAVGGSTGKGGATAFPGGSTSVAGGVVVPSVPPGADNPMSGRLHRVMPIWATAGAPSVGGTTGRGGASPVGGTTGRGGATGYGGKSVSVGGGSIGIAGAAGATGNLPVEVVSYWPFCTATLIGPNAVMSAKHCIEDLNYMSGVEVGFAVGPDASKPTAVYPIVDWDWETEVPADPSLLLADLGSDVGVVHLGLPVTGVTPMAIGTLDATDVGKRFTAMGYGVQDNYEHSGTRKAGSVTLRGTGGNYADYAFGGLEGFLKAAKTMPAFEGLSDEYLTEIYYQLDLLPDYQAFFGGKCGDAQPCYGDSGGPIIATRNGVRTVFGNITSGFGSSRLICDYGVVAAIFGPLTKSYLDNALTWVDPCASVTVKGHCDGDLAIRCTNRLEGSRRISETDCGLLDQTCGLDATGTVACVDR